MKKLLLIIIIGFLAQVGWGVIARGKTGSADQTGGSSAVITWTGGGSSTAGNALLVYVMSRQDFSRTFLVADDGSNVYSSSNVVIHPNGINNFIAYCIPNSNSATTITVTASGYEIFSAFAVEVAGLTTTNPLDKITAMYDNGYRGGTSWTSNATGTLSQADEFVVVGLLDSYTAVAAYACSDYTQDGHFAGNAIWDKTVSTTDSITSTGTLTDPGGDYRVGAITLTYKGAGGGSGTLIKEQTSFRFRKDDGSEISATWKANENTTITESTGTNVRARFVLNTSTVAYSGTPQIEYKKSTDANYVAVSTFQPVINVPTVRGTGTIVGGTGAINATLAAGTTTNDIIVAFIESTGSIPSFASWTQCASAPIQATTGNTTIPTQLNVWWYRVLPDVTIPVAIGDSGDHQICRTITISSCVASGNPWCTTNSSSNTTNSLSATIVGGTTTVSQCLIFVVATSSVDFTSVGAFSGWTNANLGSITEQIDNLNTSGNGGGFGVITATSSVSSYGTTTVNFSSKSMTAMWTGALMPYVPPLKPIIISTSTFFISGSTTTAQLTAPSGKDSTYFSSGTITSNQNPLPTLSMVKDKYTELEWCLQASTAANTNDIYYFRLSGMDLNQAVTAAWTIGTAAAAATVINTFIPRNIIFEGR